MIRLKIRVASLYKIQMAKASATTKPYHSVDVMLDKRDRPCVSLGAILEVW